MASNWDGYYQVVIQLQSYNNIPTYLINSLWTYGKLVYHSEQQNKFSKPMMWIGNYIAFASLLCILAMVSDLIHGLRNRKLWFPCKYFTLNAASLSVITVAMKLLMDLNNPMPGFADHTAKLGSMAFMCTIMANLLPSLSTMDNKQLLTNIIALGILVITMVVNVCIQIKTGVVSYSGPEHLIQSASGGTYFDPELCYHSTIPIVYVAMLLILLIIHASSSLAILSSKQILESKYQAGHKTSVKDLELQNQGRLSVEKVKKHVSNHWIMAETGSPQFITACSATSSASGVICALTTIIYVVYMFLARPYMPDYKSDYKWSVLVILITQFVGVVLGSIAPIFRCFACFSFKLSLKWIWNHIKVFKVESYWTQQLSEWKQSSIPFSFRSRKYTIFIQMVRILILSFCIRLQQAVVVACKIIGMVPIPFVICVLCFSHSGMWINATFSASGIVLRKRPEQLEQIEDLSLYVLQLHNDMELAERTVKGISKSVNKLIQKAEKQQPNNLIIRLCY